LSSTAPVDALTELLADDLVAVNALITERMESENAPRIPEVTAHLIGAGGKRLRPMLTLACARMCGYDGTRHHLLATTVEFIHTATLLHKRAATWAANRQSPVGQQIRRAGWRLSVLAGFSAYG